MTRQYVNVRHRLLLAALIVLVLLAVYGMGWFFLPSNQFGAFSPWERLTGETPSAKATAYVDAVSRGDEASALALWELPKVILPNGRAESLQRRRIEVTRALIAAGVRSDATIRSVEW